jgi:hypothetical protein
MINSGIAGIEVSVRVSLAAGEAAQENNNTGRSQIMDVFWFFMIGLDYMAAAMRSR